MNHAHIRNIPVSMAQRVMMLGALALLALTTSALGAPGPSKPEVKVTAVGEDGAAAKVSVEAVNADVKLVIRALADVGKLSVVFADGSSGRVTLVLRDVTLADAMNSAAFAAGLGIVPMGGGSLRVVKP